MKYIFLAALVLTAPLFGQAPVLKPVPNPIADFAPEALKKDDFASLLKGNSLEGWVIRGSKAQYTVKDGVIMGKGENLRSNSFLCTEKTYRDFIFTFQFKFDHLKGNSGCMFRGLLNHQARVYGYQCEHDNTDRSWTAGIYDESRRQWIFPNKNNPEHCTAFTEQGRRVMKMDDWNTITIKCLGNHIQIWINGELRTDFKDTDPKNATVEGFFGLQVHSGKTCDVRWRNLYLKELK